MSPQWCLCLYWRVFRQLVCSDDPRDWTEAFSVSCSASVLCSCPRVSVVGEGQACECSPPCTQLGRQRRGQANEENGGKPGCPVVGGAGAAAPSSSAQVDCPVISPDFDPRNLMPRSSNRPTEGQSKPLSTQRALSSIPIGAPRRRALLSLILLL